MSTRLPLGNLVVLLIAAVAAVVVFVLLNTAFGGPGSQLASQGGSTYELTLRLANSGQLLPKSLVMVNGLRVGEVTNIGSDFEVSIGDAADIIAELMGRKISIRVDEERLRPDASEVERLWAATEKAKALTDWRPQYAGREGFQRGLTETIAWFKDPRNLAGYDPTRYQV